MSCGGFPSDQYGCTTLVAGIPVVGVAVESGYGNLTKKWYPGNHKAVYFALNSQSMPQSATKACFADANDIACTCQAKDKNVLTPFTSMGWLLRSPQTSWSAVLWFFYSTEYDDDDSDSSALYANYTCRTGNAFIFSSFV
jgi:hypothetical protein